MKLQSKILLAVVPLIVIPLLTLGGIAYQRLQQTATDTLTDQMRSLLQQSTQQVQAFEQTVIANVHLFSASEMLHGYLLASEAERYDLLQLPLLKLFSSYQQAYPAYIEIRVILPDGYEETRFAIPDLPNLSDDEKETEYFKHWLTEPKETHLSYLRNPDTQDSILQVAQELKFSDPTAQERGNIDSVPLQGFLVISARLDYLAQLAKNNKVGKQGELLFADASGIILFHPQAAKVGQKLPAEVLNLMQNQQPAQFSVQGIQYQWQALNPNLWVFTLLSETELLAESRRLGFTVAAITLAAILITLLLLMMLLNKLLLKPIHELTTATLHLEHGHLEAQLIVRSHDEMGILAQRFNKMAQHLKTAQQQKDQAQAEALENKEKAIENLKQADRLKDEFLANTSHELRTPLNGIIGIGQSLLDGIGGTPNPLQAQNLRMIVQSGKRLATLVNDILDSLKMRTKELQLQCRPVDIYAMSSLALELSNALVLGKPVVLENAVARDLPPVYADENRLQQILLNLIGNAIKFTHVGQVSVSAFVNAQGLMEICIADTGIGIPANKLEVIFHAFEQADGSTAREYGGTGLGLSVTQQLVELHGGVVRVESQEGVGSRFYFTLPLSAQALPNSATTDLPTMTAEAVARAAEAEAESVAEYGILSCEAGADEGQCRVLIVDDEPVNLQVLVNYLSMHNYQLTLASSGPEALGLLESGYEPDIIILDVMMPRMTGFEVTHIIRNTWKLNELPILLLTAKNQAQDIVTGLEAGANDYLVKPIAREELLARIRTHLSIKRLKASREAALEMARLKSEFLANMSHEIRTPMNAIIGVSELLSGTQLTEEQMDYTNTIRTGSETLLALINDILDFSKIEAGKLELETQPFWVRACVEEALDLVRGSASKKGLNLVYWIDWSVPMQMIGDITRLRQTLVNLLSNAVKFTQEGEIMVKVIAQAQNLETTPAQYEFIFSVQDTGIGISKEQQQKLFQSFSQIDSSITRRYGGTGLGLAISKRLIEFMHGKIWVESLEQQGTTFSFSVCQPGILHTEPLPVWQLQQQPFVGKQILLVGENTNNREVLQHFLSYWGATLTCIDKQNFVADKLQNLPIDCVFIELPPVEQKTTSLLEHVQALQQQLRFSLVLIAPICRSSLVSELFDHCLAKPIRPQPLYELLAKEFSKHKTAEVKPIATPKLPEHILPNADMRILLTEDNRVNQKVATLLLKQLGFQADIANNGVEALEALQVKDYDLIFMDMQMPEMDGLTATREIHKQFPSERIPWIVAMTANAMKEDQRACFDAGMNDYVSKPIRQQKLSAALARFNEQRVI